MDLYELAEEWFKEKDEKIRKKGPPHYRILEYQRIRFLWEEFGLSVLDLDIMETRFPGWIDAMVTIGSAKTKVMNLDQEPEIKPQAPISMQPSGLAGKRVIRRKLL